jgi:hypothetical protein
MTIAPHDDASGALDRGRSTRAISRSSRPSKRCGRAFIDTAAAVLVQYVERSNRRDLDGLRELVRTDARVRVADRFTGPLGDSGYFGRYAQFAAPWRFVLADVDGAPMVVAEYDDDGVWVGRGIVRLEVRDGRIAEIADCKHRPWILGAAEIRPHPAIAVDTRISSVARDVPAVTRDG